MIITLILLYMGDSDVMLSKQYWAPPCWRYSCCSSETSWTYV